MSIHSRVSVAAVASAILCLASSQSSAKVKVDVDLDMQTMHVQGKDKSFDTKVSSGKNGFETPAGSFKVLWMDRDHHSETYDNAAMPNAIFFAPGYAIHGFGKSPWGHKASHGCIRVPVARSAELFDMVKAEGGAEITVTGVTDAVAPTVAQAEARARAKAEGQREAEASPTERQRAFADETPYAGRRQRAYADEAYYRSAPRAYGQRAVGYPADRAYPAQDGYYYRPAYGYGDPYGSGY